MCSFWRTLKSTLSVQASVAIAVLLLAASCQPRSEVSESVKAGQTDGAGEALPSMSRYTSEKVRGQTVGGLNPSDDDITASEQLNPGEYCFRKAGRENWLSIRVQVDEAKTLTGEAAGTVNHPEKGKTLYQQTFSGELAGRQAVVDVTTYLADTASSRQESWTVTPTQLDMGRIAIAEVSCLEISSDF